MIPPDGHSLRHPGEGKPREAAENYQHSRIGEAGIAEGQGGADWQEG